MDVGSPQWMYSAGADDYNIPYSCRFDSTRNSVLLRTMGTPTNAKKWVYSGWHKQGKVNHEEQSLFSGGLDGSGDGEGDIQLNAQEQLYVYQYYGAYQYRYISTAKFRDPSAWYHIVVAVDTTQGTAANRVKIYVNGAQVTDWATETHPSQNLDSRAINTACQHRIGNERSDSREFDGYISETHFIDGMSFFSDTSGTANSSFNINTFGKTGNYGEWKPIEVTDVTYGNNGFYHDFAVSGTLGNDVSGNNNDYTESGIGAKDQMLDSPTNNFAVLNPLWQDSSITLQEGNLRSSRNANMNRPSQSTISLGTGKWYFEALDQYTTGNQIGVEWEGADVETYVHTSGTKAYTWSSSGSTYAEGTYQSGNNGGSVASGARIRMVAYDGATGKLWGGANGTWGSSGNPAAGTNESMTVPVAYRDKMHFVVATENSSTSQGIIANFGQDSSFVGIKTAQGNQDGNDIGDFYYTPPTGFLALCTSNLPEPDIIPSEHFNTALYTGTGSIQSISGVGFQSDFTWIKSRSNTDQHNAFDAVRYHGILVPNTNAAEGDTGGGWLRSWSSDGFSVDVNGPINTNNQTYVAWNWKGGNAISGTGDFTQGTRPSTCSRNVDAGFSIVSYTGDGVYATTVGHGLSKAPEIVIIKERDNNQEWVVNLKNIPAFSAGADMTALLNDDNNMIGYNTGSYYWRGFAPTATLFGMSQVGELNQNNVDYIAYCWHSVEGFSKLGSYTGNGSTDGTFLYTGFRPAFILYKNGTDNNTNWIIMDNKRDTYNPNDDLLYPNTSDDEEEDLDIDFLSNGFKFRNTSSWANSNGKIYFYMAFAETPFKYSNAR